MRVMHVSAGLGVETQGVHVVVKGLSSAQNLLGAEVLVAGTSTPGQSNKKLGWDGVDGITLPVVGPRAFGFSPRLLSSIEAPRPDIVHAHGLWMYPILAAYMAANKLDVPLVVSPHGMLSQVALSFSSKRKKVAEFLYQSRCLQQARLLHATCRGEVEDIRRFGLTQPIALIPNGIGLPKIIPSSDVSARHKVLSLGRIHPKKGLDVLIEAWGGVERDFPNWDLLIAGPDEGGHQAQLERMARGRSLNNIKFLGPVFGEEKTKLLASSSLFALPTRSENFAMTVAESLVVATPVISSKGAPWARLDRKGCGWWVEGDPETFAKTLRAAMSLSDAERQQMGQAGRVWMEREFSWENIAREMLEAYQWCLGGGSVPSHVLID